MVNFLLKKLSYKLYQKWFCRQYIKRVKALPEYKYFLKYQSKKDWVRNHYIDVAIYDILDNNGMNKLIKSLYRLKKCNLYEVETHYLIRRFKKLDYINSNMIGQQTGSIGNVKFKNDKWLHEIKISYTYINNSEAIIEYCYRFNKVMSTYIQIHDFVVDNILKIKKPWYFHTYADKSIIKKANYRELWELEDIFFADILQSYIFNLFYTKLGNRYKLPTEYSCKIYRYNFKKAKRLKNAFLQECYVKGKEHILISDLQYGRMEITHYYSGKYFKSPILLGYFLNFSIELYYKIFRKIEICELEKHMRKYLNSRKTLINSKDIKWLINKIRYIREQEKRIEFVLNDEKKFIEHMIGWTLHIAGKKEDEDFIDYPTNTNYFKTLYEQNLEYLTSIASVQNDKIVIVVSIATFLLTIISIIITIF